MVIELRQIGHREDVVGVGAGTVRIGRRVVAEIGGCRLGCAITGGEVGVSVVPGGMANDTELVGRGFGGSGMGGKPDIIGGGSSNPSVALRES